MKKHAASILQTPLSALKVPHVLARWLRVFPSYQSYSVDFDAHHMACGDRLILEMKHLTHDPNKEIEHLTIIAKDCHLSTSFGWFSSY